MRSAAPPRPCLTRPAQVSRLLALAATLLSTACGPDGASGALDAKPGAAGPLATATEAATSGPGSPAHAVYAARGFGCAECHPCGKRVAGGHDVTWMDAASAGFHAYAANRDLASCRTCHGAALDGAGGTTTVSCARCHGASWRTACTTCHGGEAGDTTGAPPRTVWGRSSDAVRVGAHAAHLGATHALAAPVACATCHAVPTDALSPGHADGDTADVALTGLAASGGAAAGWTRATATCTTYCHGATLAGGSVRTPTWTDATGAARACGACHGAPPPAPHSQSTACGSCHAGYTATSVNLQAHLNGTVDAVALACTSCHGAAGQAATAASPRLAAPPVDASGASTGVRVGAHQKHLAGGTYAAGLACTSCHAAVGGYTTGHANGTRDVGFTGGANANLQRGTWNAGAGTAAGSCSSTWCHGAVISRAGGPVGGTATTPSWTGTVAACTACHAVVITSLSGRHTSVSEHRRYACSTCHGAGYTATVTSNVATGTGVNRATHVDGLRTIVTVASGTGIRTWNPTTRSCSPSCHGRETW